MSKVDQTKKFGEKEFKNNVRWDFKISISGYGKNVRDALLDAFEREGDALSIISDKDSAWLAIENHEVVDIDEKDIK